MSGRVLIVEDHALVAIGLQLALSARDYDVESDSGPTPSDVVDHARRFAPHCVLLDLHLGRGLGSGVELIRPLAEAGAKVVMMTAESRRMALAACLEAGAVGWIGKGALLDEVDAVLRAVIGGESLIGRTDQLALLDELWRERARIQRGRSTFAPLSHRESLVLGALSDGLSADEIAESQFVALTTVRSQIRAVLRKLGVRSQAAAVALAGTYPELLPQRARDGRDRRRIQIGQLSCGPEFRR